MGTKIEWADESWNPVSGCTKLSAGCKNCYAERMSKRLAGRFGYPADEPFRVTLHHDRLEQPLRWRETRTVFVCSMGDLFHKDVPDVLLNDVFNVMVNLAPQHTYIVLTKRVERMTDFLQMTRWLNRGRLEGEAQNVWLGTSIESPEYCYRAQYLRQTRAAVRFLSMEPLLASFAEYPGVIDDMDWVIVGGESGSGARPMHPDWARDLRDQCQAAGVPFFFKQWGEWAPAGPIEVDPHFLGGKVASDPYRGGRFAVDSKLLGNRRARYHYFGNEIVIYVGKKRAGRILDGREWDEYPSLHPGWERR